MIKNLFLLITTLFLPVSVLADSFVAEFIEYSVHNPVIEFLIKGGHYTLVCIAFLVLISIISRKLRGIILSVIFAAFLVLILLFSIDQFNSFEIIPDDY